MKKILLSAAAVLLASSAAHALTVDEMNAFLKEHPDVILNFIREHKEDLASKAAPDMAYFVREPKTEAPATPEEGEKAIKEAVAKQLEKEAKEMPKEKAEKPKPAPAVPEKAEKKELDAGVKLRLDDRPLVGKADAKAKVVVFVDFSKPECAENAKILDAFMKKHGNAAAVFKPVHEGGFGEAAARMFLALSLQDMKNAMGFYQKVLSDIRKAEAGGEQFLFDAAGDGVNVSMLRTGMQSKRMNKRISEDAEDARLAGMHGAPVTVVGTTVLHGVLKPEELEAAFTAVK